MFWNFVQKKLRFETREVLADICSGVNGIATIAMTNSEWGWINAKWQRRFGV